jgi:sugar phosphate isomerase/epimerase
MNNRQGIHLGVVAEALADDLRQAPRLARLGGFAGVQFDVFASALHLPDLSATGRRDFVHSLTAQDQRLAGLRADTGAKGLSGGDVDRVIARLDTAMELAAGLGPRLLCVEIGPLPEPPSQPRPKSSLPPAAAGLILIPTADEIAMATGSPAEESTPRPVDHRAMSQVDGAMIELGKRADRYGVTVAFRSDLAGFAALERALRAADCPWFGVDLDPSAVLRDAWDQGQIFSRLGPAIRHVRGKDAVVGSGRRTKPAVVGQGNVDWPRLLADLDDAGFRGWLTVDPLELPDRAAGARAALKTLSRRREE